MMTAMTGEGGDGDVEEGDIRELWEGLIRNSVEEGVVRVKDVEGLMGEGLGGMVLGTQEEVRPIGGLTQTRRLKSF